MGERAGVRDIVADKGIFVVGIVAQAARRKTTNKEILLRRFNGDIKIHLISPGC